MRARSPAALLRALVAAQLIAIAVLGAVTVARFHVFAEIDERAHYAFVQEVAEQGRLPWLGRDVISWQAQAINDSTWPRRSPRDPRAIGFPGQSYEAFQPPLYYAVAAPVFAAGGDHRQKVFVLRAFGLLLLGAGLLLLALLARAALGARWLAGYALALAVVLWPGVIVRAVTVSNQALEPVLVLGFLLAAWHATVRRSRPALVAAGALLGLCLLTKLTLVFLAPVLLVALVGHLRDEGRRDRRTVVAAGLAVVLPALLLAPWIASNLDRYGAPTANAIARDQQEPVVNPGGEDLGIAQLPGRAKVVLTEGLLPQEWRAEYGRGALAVALRAIPLALFVAGALAFARGRRRRRDGPGGPHLALLAAPAVLAVLMVLATLVLAHWDISFLRYANAVLPAFALHVAWGLRDRVVVALAAAGTVVTLAVWAFMAGAYFFTDAGAALGIHAAQP